MPLEEISLGEILWRAKVLYTGITAFNLDPLRKRSRLRLNEFQVTTPEISGDSLLFVCIHGGRDILLGERGSCHGKACPGPVFML
jgi:hypothetical protein